MASIGFRAKTARAIAVALTHGNRSPVYVARWEAALHDPHFPATSQPHHEVMGLPWADAQSAVQHFERRIEAVAGEVLSKIIAMGRGISLRRTRITPCTFHDALKPRLAGNACCLPQGCQFHDVGMGSSVRSFGDGPQWHWGPVPANLIFLPGGNLQQ